ncbi:MAG: LptF/LptG family permease [Bacillota bacterium]
MQIYKRYLYQEMVAPFFFGFSAFASVLVGPQLLRQIQNGVPFSVAMKIVWWGTPQIIAWILPMSMLFATMLSLGRLSGHSEVIAMRAGGISIISIAKPFIFIGLLVSLLGIYLKESIVPYAESRIKEIEALLLTGKQGIKQSNLMSILEYEPDGSIRSMIYAQKVQGKVFIGATVVNKEKGQVVSMINAAKIFYDQDRGWFAENGTIYFYDNDRLKPTYKMYFTSGAGATKLKIARKPEDLIPSKIESNQYTFKELRKLLLQMGINFPQVRQKWVDLHNKISIPFAALIFVLIGVPLGIHSNRRNSSVGFGMCVVVIMIYYLMLLLGNTLGNTILPPVIASWWQNIVLGGYGIYKIIKIN